MLEFDFDIVYRSGCENKAVDALSRKPIEERELKVLSFAIPVGVDKIQEEVMKDERLKQIIHDLLKGIGVHAGYQLKR